MPNTEEYESNEVRPWGRYDVLDRGEGYLVKRLVINPRSETSLQKHYHRQEYWLVVGGYPNLELHELEDGIHKGITSYGAYPGMSLRVRRGMPHRIKNNSDEYVTIIETWMGDDLRENDIERLEDKYGRV